MIGHTNALPGCPYCGPGVTHGGMCPKIREIEYHPNGSVKKVVLK